MLFRRRNPLSLRERIKLALWPANGWRRSISYIGKRVLRLSGSPHAIAAGFAAGVFSTFTPFLGFHFAISFLAAFLIGGNMIAAAFGTVVGNPLTYPLMWLASYKVGNILLGVDHAEMAAHEISANLAEMPLRSIVPLLKPLVVGGVPLGLAFGLLGYFIVRWGVTGYQRARRERLEARRLASNQLREPT
jgi:uncharacterized protein (DUF2062 family)